MRAKELVAFVGEDLVGQRVTTIKIGNYPGGEAIVTEIAPDPNAPEISFDVLHPTEGVMGIFDYEEVEVIE